MEAYQRLEEEFGKWAGVKNVVACASGTSALHLALEAMCLPPGSEAITADFNMIAVPRAITLAGLVPVFVDCGDDLLVNPYQIKAKTDKARAIIAVHIYGRRCRMDKISNFLEWRALCREVCPMFVIEDLAEAHGVIPHPRTDAAIYSFYRNKVIAGEEGGAVAFKNPVHAALARSLRSLGFTDAHDFNHVPRGHNYRLSNAHASLILDSLANVEANLAERRSIEGWYNSACPDAWKMPARDVPWIYDLRIPGLTVEDQSRIVRRLNEAGIAARHGFKPMSTQEEFKSCRVVGTGKALVASREVIYLPLTPGKVTRKDACAAFDMIHRCLGTKHRSLC